MIADVIAVIPANNEEALISECLAALHQAMRHCPVPVTCLVALDSCTDGTAAVLGRFPAVQRLQGTWGAVGAARDAGVRTALAHCRRLSSTLIACTDADSRPPPEWLAEMVRRADNGADVICGSVRPLLGDAPSRHRWDQHYRADRARLRIHGANLGIRASTYVDVGGFEPVRSGEDRGLVLRACARERQRVVSAPDLVVDTSARLEGRAPGGVATDLRRVLAGAA